MRVRPLDPRLLRHAAAARRYVAPAAGIAVLTAIPVMVQAQLLAVGISGAFLGGAGPAALVPLLAGLLAVVTGRAVLGRAGEVAAYRASADVLRELRSRLVAQLLRLGPHHRRLPPTGKLAALATRGLDGLEGCFSRYLPTLLVAAVVPAVVAGRILLADWVAGLIIGLTVPLIPLFMVLIGRRTEQGTRRRWRTLAVLSHQFLDLVAGLDTLVAFGRAGRQTVLLRAVGARFHDSAEGLALGTPHGDHAPSGRPRTGPSDPGRDAICPPTVAAGPTSPGRSPGASGAVRCAGHRVQSAGSTPGSRWPPCSARSPRAAASRSPRRRSG